MGKIEDYGEPWPVPPTDDNEHDRWFGKYLDDGNYYWYVKDCDLRRAVACVNACAGLDPQEARKMAIAMMILSLPETGIGSDFWALFAADHSGRDGEWGAVDVDTVFECARAVAERFPSIKSLVEMV